MNKQSENEKKLIQIFKTFVERALLPQIRKSQGSLAEWNKFSTLLFADTLNYNDMQFYVNTIAVPPTSDTEKSMQINRKMEVVPVQNKAFNPNSTFGGEKNRINVVSLNESEGPKESRDQAFRQRSNTSNVLLANLEKLLQSLEQNQSVIDNFRTKQQVTPTRPIRDTSVNPKENGQKTHSFTYIPTQQQTYSLSQNQTMPLPYMNNPHIQVNQNTSTTIGQYQKNYY